jgi:DNA-binding NarL/FixJ family response regulator
VTPRNRKILEHVVLGGSPKAIAMDLNLAGSTIACVIKQALGALGVGSTRVPLGLAILVHAARGLPAAEMDRRTGFVCQGVECEIFSAPLPSLTGVLSPAVREVVCLHAQGHSHARIAARRRTSQRTVANQLATAFIRLGVSGRSGLLEYLTSNAHP